MYSGDANGTVELSRSRPDGYVIEFKENRETGVRSYHLRDATGTRVRLPSCTTVLGRISSKDSLLNWYEMMGAAGAVRVGRQGLLRGVEPDDAIDVVREHGAGAGGHTALAKHRGLALHSILEHYGRTREVLDPAGFPVEWHGYIRALFGWLLDNEPQVTAVEQLVAHRAYGFAGRFDLRALAGQLDTIVDLKTRERPRVYFDDLLQVAFYDVADQDCGSPPAQRRAVVAIGANGEYAEASAPQQLVDAVAFGLGWHNAIEPIRRAFERHQRAARPARAA
jgi:hypothetical protein